MIRGCRHRVQYLKRELHRYRGMYYRLRPRTQVICFLFLGQIREGVFFFLLFFFWRWIGERSCLVCIRRKAKTTRSCRGFEEERLAFCFRGNLRKVCAWPSPAKTSTKLTNLVLCFSTQSPCLVYRFSEDTNKCCLGRLNELKYLDGTGTPSSLSG